MYKWHARCVCKENVIFTKWPLARVQVSTCTFWRFDLTALLDLFSRSQMCFYWWSGHLHACKCPHALFADLTWQLCWDCCLGLKCAFILWMVIFNQSRIQVLQLSDSKIWKWLESLSFMHPFHQIKSQAWCRRQMQATYVVKMSKSPSGHLHACKCPESNFQLLTCPG